MTVTDHSVSCCTNVIPTSDSHLACLKRIAYLPEYDPILRPRQNDQTQDRVMG